MVSSQTSPSWVKKVEALLDARDRNRTWLAKKMFLSQSMMTRLMAEERNLSPAQMGQIANIHETPEFMIFGPQEEP